MPKEKADEKLDFGFVSGDEPQVLSDWAAFKEGYLASAGGWHDQDAVYRHDMLMVDALYAEEYNKLAKEHGGRR